MCHARLLARQILLPIAMLMSLTHLAHAELLEYTPERLQAARQSSPYVAVHFLTAEAASDLPAFSRQIAAEAPEAAGVRHIVILPAERSALAAAAELPLLMLADPQSTAQATLDVRSADLPATLLFERGKDRPLERVFERGGRPTPNIRALNARLSRVWRHAALDRHSLTNGVALGNMDPVSYHAPGATAPKPGNPSITSEYRGITYRFENAQNRALFAADPEKYLPAAGGWCALAMARGEQVEADPATFTIRDGRLHVFYKGIYGDSREEFLAEAATLAPVAQQNWNRIATPQSR